VERAEKKERGDRDVTRNKEPKYEGFVGPACGTDLRRYFSSIYMKSGYAQNRNTKEKYPSRCHKLSKPK